MLHEVEVTAVSNSPMDLDRVFDLLDEPRTITAVFTADLSGEDRWCRVTGWNDDGPCPAYAAKAEDSGEGVVLLVYGGNDGIRFQPSESADPWDLNDPAQWGEPCLMLGADTAFQEEGTAS